MGQRAQIFIIAKADGRYRSIAVAHHQWLYGVSSLQACLRLLTIFSDRANRIALNQELAFVAEFYAANLPYAEDDDEKQSHRLGIEPFPFVCTCLHVGLTMNTSTGNCDIAHRCEFNMRYDEGDNNNGIIVIDITDLDNLRYCFIDFHGMESSTEVPLHTPLTGWEFVLSYYTLDEEPLASNRHVATALEKYALIDLKSLNDCWPDPDWKVAKTEEGDEDGDTKVNTNDKSLKDMATAKLMDEMLSGSDQDMSALDHALQIPGYQKDLLRYVTDHGDKVAQSPVAVEILRRALASQTILDLSPFRALSAESIRHLLNINQIKDMARIYNLSGTTAVSPAEIVETFKAIETSQVDEFYALALPNRIEDDTAFYDALRSGQLRNVRLPKKMVLGSIFSLAMAEQEGSYWPSEPWGRSTEPTKGLPDMDPSHVPPSFPVVQVLVRLNTAQQFLYGDQTPQEVENVYIGDALVDAERFIAGLVNMMHIRLAKYGDFMMASMAWEAALAFSTAPSTIARLTEGGTQPPASEIGLPPNEAMRVGRRNKSVYGGGPKPMSPLRVLTPDHWTCVLAVKTKDTVRARDVLSRGDIEVAFVRAKEDVTVAAVEKEENADNEKQTADEGQKVHAKDLEIVDLETFAKMTCGPSVSLKALREAVKAVVQRAVSLPPRRKMTESDEPEQEDEAQDVSEEKNGEVFRAMQSEEVVRSIQSCMDWERHQRKLDNRRRSGVTMALS